MANFIEFEYNGTTQLVNINLIVEFQEPNIGGSINCPNGYWTGYRYINRSLNSFFFPTQAEAQELYDKLRGKKKEDSPIAENATTSKTETVESTSYRKSENYISSLEVSLRESGERIQCLEQKLEEKRKICESFIDDCYHITNPYKKKIYQIREYIEYAERIFNSDKKINDGKFMTIFSQIKHILEDKDV